MRVTILGCGSSGGVPLIGCACKVCTSDNPKNNRSRVSLFIKTNEKNILIDTSPDLRQQALREGIGRVDAVLYTHDHADHTHGIDDLRSFNYLSGNSIPIYSDEVTIKGITGRFPYVFMEKPQNVWYRPSLTAHSLPDVPVHEFSVFKTPITAFQQLHGKMKTLGYRIGNLAYSTDTNELPETALKALEGVRVWVVDCLRYSHSPGHSNLENTLRWIARVKPEQAILTHMSHDFDYDTLTKELPVGVIPAYDGLSLDLSR